MDVWDLKPMCSIFSPNGSEFPEWLQWSLNLKYQHIASVRYAACPSSKESSISLTVQKLLHSNQSTIPFLILKSVVSLRFRLFDISDATILISITDFLQARTVYCEFMKEMGLYVTFVEDKLHATLMCQKCWKSLIHKGSNWELHQGKYSTDNNVVTIWV